jgi:hypothetical protein
VALEIVYTATASLLMIAAYSAVRYWIRTPAQEDSAVRARREVADRAFIKRSKPVAIRDVDLTRSPYNLLLITSPSCQFCINSAPFHRALVEAAAAKRIPLWIAVPDVRKDRGFLASSGLHGVPSVNWRDVSRRAQGVPLVVLLGADAIARGLWVGELRREEEANLLAAMDDPSKVTIPRRKLSTGELILNDAEFRTLASANRATIVSIEERGLYEQEHPAGAINIPLAELGMRAERDLRKDQFSVIDCSALPDVVCSLTVEQLRKRGFRAAAADFGGE